MKVTLLVLVNQCLEVLLITFYYDNYIVYSHILSYQKCPVHCCRKDSLKVDKGLKVNTEASVERLNDNYRDQYLKKQRTLKKFQKCE